MIKRDKKQNGREPGVAERPMSSDHLPPVYSNGIQVIPGDIVATAVFTMDGVPVAKLAIAPNLIADMPIVWQTAAARMGLYNQPKDPE